MKDNNRIYQLNVNNDKFSNFLFEKLGYKISLLVIFMFLIWILASLYSKTFFEIEIPQELADRNIKTTPMIKAYIVWILATCTILGSIFVVSFLRIIPKTFYMLFENGVIVDQNNKQPLKKYNNFLKTFEDELNSKKGFFLSFILIGLATLLPLLTLRTPMSEVFEIGFDYPLLFPIPFLVPIIVNSLIYLVFGMVMWKGFILIKYLGKLSKQFKIKIKPLHPDKSGGLKPIGELCLEMNKIILIFGIGIALWIILPHPERFNIILYIYLLIYILFGIFFFFFPLWSTHDAMKVQKREFLEDFTKKLDIFYAKAYHEIVEKGTRMNRKRVEEIQNLDILYQRAEKMPIWPFDYHTIGRFFTTIIFPILLILIDWLIREIFS